MHTGGQQEGIPKGQGIAALESLRFRPKIGDGKENDIGEGSHIGKSGPGLRLGESDRRQFSAGGEEFAPNLPGKRQRPNRGPQMEGACLLVRVTGVVAVQPYIGIKNVHGARPE